MTKEASEQFDLLHGQLQMVVAALKTNTTDGPPPGETVQPSIAQVTAKAVTSDNFWDSPAQVCPTEVFFKIYIILSWIL